MSIIEGGRIVVLITVMLSYIPRFFNLVINLSQNKKFLDEFKKVFGSKNNYLNFKTVDVNKKRKVFEHFSIYYRKRISFKKNCIEKFKKASISSRRHSSLGKTRSAIACVTQDFMPLNVETVNKTHIYNNA
jgi:hypothetical protein